MTSVITGDIIQSRQLPDPRIWSKPLKKMLATLGKSPETWEIYRGDSFQLEVFPADAFLTALRIKSVIKCHKGLDVRMAIGIGNRQFEADAIKESTGEAFIYSGEKLEALKKEKQTLAIKSAWKDFDAEWNVIFRLALITLDSWGPKAAETVSLVLEHPDMDQQHISRHLGIAKSSVSERLKRAHLDEMLDLESLYRKQINILVTP